MTPHLRDLARETPGVEGASLFGDVVHVRLSEGVHWERVATALRAGGVEGLRSEVIAPGLEDVFIHRVEERDGGGRHG